MAVILKKQLPFTVQVDGEDVRVYIKRMTLEEYAPFAAEFLVRAKQQTPSESVVRTRADQIQRDAEEAREYTTWLTEIFEKFVTVHPGDLQLENEEIRSGGDFVRALASYDGVVSSVLAQMYVANRLSGAQKKTFSLLSASATGSPQAPSPAANGPAPEMTAASAETPGSARSAPVADLPPSASSGTTAPLSSASAPSGS